MGGRVGRDSEFHTGRQGGSRGDVPGDRLGCSQQEGLVRGLTGGHSHAAPATRTRHHVITIYGCLKGEWEFDVSLSPPSILQWSTTDDHLLVVCPYFSFLCFLFFVLSPLQFCLISPVPFFFDLSLLLYPQPPPLLSPRSLADHLPQLLSPLCFPRSPPLSH